jgi:hypothetical protein
MKRIIYFISTVLISALYSCSGQYDDIDEYATSESIYVGRYDNSPVVKIGYNRVEIDLVNTLVFNTDGSYSYEPSRIGPDEFYLGKARKTVVEYDLPDSTYRIRYDSVCSWVNITGLTLSRTYIFRIYTEDEYGNKSIPIEAMGKPFTDDDFAGYSFPIPRMIPSPSTMEFKWTGETGLSSSLYEFADLKYSYVNRNGKTITGKLTAKDNPSFSIVNLEESEIVPISIDYRIIPIMESGPILDTVMLSAVFEAKTVSAENYMSARSFRPILGADINPDNTTEATISWGTVTDHLVWMDIRYEHLDGTVEDVRVGNDQASTYCANIKRGVTIKARACYNPPQTEDVFITEWKEVTSFLLKYYRTGWVVVARTGNHPWGGDGVGTQTLWDGGKPILILDDDHTSGWHSVLGSSFPQVLVIDMLESRPVSEVVLANKNKDGYWYHIELYLTDEAFMPGYYAHTINLSEDKVSRQAAYQEWETSMRALLPSSLPAASWGAPVAQVQYKTGISNYQTMTLSQTRQGRFLIVVFPDNNSGWSTYIDVENVDVYTE